MEATITFASYECAPGKADCDEYTVAPATPVIRNACTFSVGAFVINCSNTEYVPFGWPAQSWQAVGALEQDRCLTYGYTLNLNGYPTGDYEWSAGACEDQWNVFTISLV